MNKMQVNLQIVNKYKTNSPLKISFLKKILGGQIKKILGDQIKKILGSQIKK